MDVLKQLYARLGVFTLHNHQVTGDRSIFDRDRAIAEWCRILGVEWREYAQNGVCRPVSKRGKRFRDHWNTWGEAPLIRIPEHRNWAGPNKLCAVSSMPETIKSDAYPCLGRQTGGSPQAQALLVSFLTSRRELYNEQMSAPKSVRTRVLQTQPYLAHGMISLSELAQSVQNALSSPTQSLEKAIPCIPNTPLVALLSHAGA